jgi:hypothetical protein
MSFFTNFVEKIINLFNFDKKHHIFFAFECIVEMFRVIMASAFMIFTPQKCYSNTNCVIDYSQPTHICSIQENLSCYNEYQNFVLYFNIFTIICFFILYVVEIKRDDWLLMNFDYSKDSNETNLEKYRDDFPYLFTNLASYNKYYYLAYKLLVIVYFLNLIFSAIILFGIKYNDINTASIFLSSIFLCFNKITTGIYLSRLAVENNLPISYYNRINLCFNEIDFDIKNNFYSKIDEYKVNLEKDFNNKHKLTKSRQNSFEKPSLTKSRQNSFRDLRIDCQNDSKNSTPQSDQIKSHNYYLINQEINLRRNSLLRKSPANSSLDFKKQTNQFFNNNELNNKKEISEKELINNLEMISDKTTIEEPIFDLENSLRISDLTCESEKQNNLKISDLEKLDEVTITNNQSKSVDSETRKRSSSVFDKEELKKIPGILIERIII